MVNDIHNLVNAFDECIFIFANRKCNKVAHSIASASLSFEETLIWMEDYPSFVAPFVVQDKNFN